MNNSIFEAVEKSSAVLKLDFSSAEFAILAEANDFSDEAANAVGLVFEHLRQKKIETTIHTILKMSRLPLKDPKTFDNFDFSVVKGKDVERLKSPSLCETTSMKTMLYCVLWTVSLTIRPYSILRAKVSVGNDSKQLLCRPAG